MNDNQALEEFLNFNETKIKKKETSFESFCSSSEQYQNQKMLHSFKELRNQLKVSRRQNEQLKEQLKICDIKLRQNKEQLDVVLQSSLSLKNQLKKQCEGHEQLKSKVVLMKETVSSLTAIQEQLHFTKNSLLQAKLQQHNFAGERAKIMEISLKQKLKHEEDLIRIQAKCKSNQEFISQLQTQLAKSKQLNIKLQNQLRKMTISYQEESFTKKWSRQNFQTQHLLQRITDYEKEISSLKQKNKKEKEKRQILQEKLLEFEQLSCVNEVKAEVYETQSDILTQRQCKYVKKIQSLNNKLNKKNEGLLEAQKTLTNLHAASEQFIFKMKIQTAHNSTDTVFQFQQKVKSIMSHKNIIKESAIKPKEVQESQKTLKQFNECYYSEKINSNNCKFSETFNKNMPNLDKNYYPNQYTFRLQNEKQNQNQEYVGIQNKVRKERDEMQRKIKQKYFQKKIQASMPSEKHKLRSQYITTFINYS